MKKRCLCLTAAFCLALPLAAQPQGYPSRPIRSVMTVAGGADIVARLVAQGLSAALGQPVVVETQSGAGGAIGAESVARAAPDGHTIMLTSASALVMNRFLSSSARLDPLKDFTPITKAFETLLAGEVDAMIAPNVTRMIGAGDPRVARLGPDPWEYGLSELNKRNYGTLVGWVHEQVLSGARPKLEDLFPREAFQLELPLPRMHEIDYKF